MLAAHWRETMGREITAIEDIEQPPDSEEAISTAPQRVAEVLDTLPDHYRRILELRFLQGRSIKDSAAELTPNTGRWMRVAASADVPDGVTRAFDLGSVSGFVRRVDGKAAAVSGVCTHQGCRLWFDAPDDRLRCPCHSTSFSPAGQVLTHQLPIAPKPLPALMVRERDGVIEVFAPPSPDQRV